MRRRGCLISAGIVAGLLLLCCVLGWFVVIPRVQNQIADEFSDELATAVADQLDAGSGSLDAGAYTISVDEIQAEVDRSLQNTDGASDFVISVDRNGMQIGFTSGSQDFGYTGRPVAENGQLRMEDMDVSNSALGFFMPADKVANIVEEAINGYFSSRGLDIQSVELGEDEIIVVAVDSGT